MNKDQIQIMEAAIKGQEEKSLQAKEAYLKESGELKAMQDNLATLCCPYSEGEAVEIMGHSHKGKRMIIKKIRRPKYSFMGRWMVCGIVLKKDGTEGKFEADFSEYHTEDINKPF